MAKDIESVGEATTRVEKSASLAGGSMGIFSNSVAGAGAESVLATAGISSMALGVGVAAVAVAAAGAGLYLYTKHQKTFKMKQHGQLKGLQLTVQMLIRQPKNSWI